MAQVIEFYGKTPVIGAERFDPEPWMWPANGSPRGLAAASLARVLELSYDLGPTLGETEHASFDLLGRDLARLYQMLS